jgi:predicted nucleotidyltransferase
MFEKVNITPLGLSLLAYLARSPGKELYVRELAKIVGGSASGSSKALDELYRSGLVEKRKAGRNVYYGINQDHPAVQHFKIFANIMDLNETIRALKENSRKIVLFGSCSTGEDTMESDIDLMVISEDLSGAREILKKARTDRKLRPIVISPRELLMLKEKDPAFYGEINKGIILWREKNE